MRCPTCDDSGKVLDSDAANGEPKWIVCPHCNGTGTILSNEEAFVKAQSILPNGSYFKLKWESSHYVPYSLESEEETVAGQNWEECLINIAKSYE